jgi:RNase P/RNase MRP subunit POP5
MRLKRRYIICQALASEEQDSGAGDEYNARDLLSVIKEKVEALFGDIGVGCFGTLSIIPLFDMKSKIFVLRTSREAETNIRFALSCITAIKTKVLIIRTLSVSGSARSCTEKLQTTFQTLVDSSNFNESSKAEQRQFYTKLMTNFELL